MGTGVASGRLPRERLPLFLSNLVVHYHVGAAAANGHGEDRLLDVLRTAVAVAPLLAVEFLFDVLREHGPEHPRGEVELQRAGHGAGKPTSKQIEDVTDQLTFLVKALEMKPAFQK